jgi:hypothetical protein
VISTNILETQTYEVDTTSVANDNVIFKPNAGPQTAFLAASEREVLYGGAAGGRGLDLSLATFCW